MSFKDFIEANKQKSSTTELVWAVIRSDGYLVVWNSQVRQAVCKKFSGLKPENVFTSYEIRDGKWKGREVRPVFIDATCMCASHDDALMNLSVKELLRRAGATTTQQAPQQEATDAKE